MISCHEYDYIEIVCMYHYPVKLILKSGETYLGVALDTERNSARNECIKLGVENGSVLVELDSIAVLEACVKNPHLNVINFGSK
ncbi:TPA: transcriptional regulator [Vibrio vulnificus]|uniref:Rho-binding antiterminator n=1 Tax=Vibrio vulnificus TaxID=672 RepID=UPI001A2F1052|nr:transcriptional regulator [Vibrio vulnificus]HAS6244632.1 transcriptional regulator [Vibrio vulnificus]HDY7947163.1 Rho-binding antiterminator [Vibrio vulnificus]